MEDFFLFQPTVSPASSADMAPISSGSSTWTSSGIPFSFVSMATGIGPSSSGSQATVASVLTSTLLAGLGFSGGVISSFPSSVWPSRVQTHNPTNTLQTAESTEPAVMSTTAKHNSDTKSEAGKSSDGQGEDGEKGGEDKEEEEEKEEEEKDRKKGKRGSGSVVKAERKDNSTTIREPHSDPSNPTAKAKSQTGPAPTHMAYGAEDQLENTPNPLDCNPPTTTDRAMETAASPAPTAPTTTLGPRSGGHKKYWPFSVHPGESSNVQATCE